MSEGNNTPQPRQSVMQQCMGPGCGINHVSPVTQACCAIVLKGLEQKMSTESDINHIILMYSSNVFSPSSRFNDRSYRVISQFDHSQCIPSRITPERPPAINMGWPFRM